MSQFSQLPRLSWLPLVISVFPVFFVVLVVLLVLAVVVMPVIPLIRAILVIQDIPIKQVVPVVPVVTVVPFIPRTQDKRGCYTLYRFMRGGNWNGFKIFWCEISHRLTFCAVLKLESRIGYVLSMVFWETQFKSEIGKHWKEKHAATPLPPPHLP